MHVAFGASAGIGGTVSVPVHLDCLILEPTLEIGGDRVLERGHLAAVSRSSRIVLLVAALSSVRWRRVAALVTPVRAAARPASAAAAVAGEAAAASPAAAPRAAPAPAAPAAASRS